MSCKNNYAQLSLKVTNKVPLSLVNGTVVIFNVATKQEPQNYFYLPASFYENEIDSFGFI